MTQGKKRILMTVIVLAIVLAAFWVYLSLAGRQSDPPGYLVRQDRPCKGMAMMHENMQETERERKDG